MSPSMRQDVTLPRCDVRACVTLFRAACCVARDDVYNWWCLRHLRLVELQSRKDDAKAADVSSRSPSLLARDCAARPRAVGECDSDQTANSDALTAAESDGSTRCGRSTLSAAASLGVADDGVRFRASGRTSGSGCAVVAPHAAAPCSSSSGSGNPDAVLTCCDSTMGLLRFIGLS